MIMTTKEVNKLRIEVKYRMTEAAVRAENTQFAIMRHIYTGRSQAFEEVLDLLGDFEEEEA
jgi:hypothetical protein